MVKGRSPSVTMHESCVRASSSRSARKPNFSITGGSAGKGMWERGSGFAGAAAANFGGSRLEFERESLGKNRNEWKDETRVADAR